MHSLSIHTDHYEVVSNSELYVRIILEWIVNGMRWHGLDSSGST
jgi:hypothetical protein